MEPEVRWKNLFLVSEKILKYFFEKLEIPETKFFT